VLHLSNHDPAGFLIKSLIIPAGIQVRKLGRKPVVLPQEDGLGDGQIGVLIRTSVTFDSISILVYMVLQSIL